MTATAVSINAHFFEVKQDNLYLEIRTRYFSLTYAKNQPFKGTATNTMKNLRIQLEGTESIWSYGHPEVRNYYGCNSTLDGFNKKDSMNKGLYSIEGFVCPVCHVGAANKITDQRSQKITHRSTLLF